MRYPSIHIDNDFKSAKKQEQAFRHASKTLHDQAKEEADPTRKEAQEIWAAEYGRAADDVALLCRILRAIFLVFGRKHNGPYLN